MPKLSPKVKIVLIICATIFLSLLIIGIFRALMVGAITAEDIIKIIGFWSDKKAMIGVL